MEPGFANVRANIRFPFAGRKWNSIPRRSEVMELLDKLDFAMLSSDWNRQDELEDLKHCADKLRKEMGE